MEDQIRQLIKNLQEILPHIPKLAEIEQLHEGTKADLAQTQTQLESAKKALSDANAGLSKAQVIAQKEYEQAIYQKQQELSALQKQVAAVQISLNEKITELRTASLQHDQIEASIESLRKRFA